MSSPHLVNCVAVNARKTVARPRVGDGEEVALRQQGKNKKARNSVTPPLCIQRLRSTGAAALWGSLALGLVALHVQGEVIGAGETALADLAPERLGAGVLAYVSGQLVGAGETPLAGGEVTLVGLLACVYPLVGLEMRTLGVGLATAREDAIVDAALLQLRVVLAVVLDGGAPRVGHLRLADPGAGLHGDGGQRDGLDGGGGAAAAAAGAAEDRVRDVALRLAADGNHPWVRRRRGPTHGSELLPAVGAGGLRAGWGRRQENTLRDHVRADGRRR